MNYAIQDTNMRVKESIRRQLDSNEFPGIQYFVLNADSTLFRYAGGFADIAGATPVQESTTMMFYQQAGPFIFTQR